MTSETETRTNNAAPYKVVVVDEAGRFLADISGTRFVSEYPDGHAFKSVATARDAALRALNKGSGPLKIVRDYGLETEFVAAEMA